MLNDYDDFDSVLQLRRVYIYKLTLGTNPKLKNT